MSHLKNIKLPLILFGLFLLAPLGNATETRVDSAGGLNLVLSDETDELTPFIFGNPAGLALLENPNRFDLAGQWLLQNSAASNQSDVFYGTLSGLSSDSTNYHGFILEPAKNWVFQLDGDILHTENQPDSGSLDKNRDRTRELFRTSLKVGSLILGGQIQGTQVNMVLAPSGYYGAQIDSIKATGSGWLGTGGILLSFPGDPLPNQQRFTLGGVYTREIIPGQSKTNLSLTFPGPAAVNLTQTLDSQNVQSFGPELYFEIPNSLQAGLLTRFSNADISLQRDSSDISIISNQASYKLQNTNTSSVLAALKMSSPLQKLTSLKTGFSLLFESGKTTDYDPSQNTISTTDGQVWQVQLGTGLEGLEKYTVGIQVKIQGISGGVSNPPGPDQAINFFSYQINLGGEQWITKQWAFRAGIVYENDLNSGALDYQPGFFPIPSGQRIVSTLITTGVGFKNDRFKTDLLFFFGQPFVYDSPNPDDFYTQVGFQLAASFLLN